MIWLVLLAGWCGVAALVGLAVAGTAALAEDDEKSLEKIVQRWSKRVE